MNSNASTGEKTGHDNSIDLDNRDARALTEYMTVLDAGGDIYTVVGENGNGEHRVDAREERCTCPDHKHRGVRCKHIRRVAFATGEESIPAWADREAIDDQLGEHVDGDLHVAASDGGVAAAPGTVDDHAGGTDPSTPDLQADPEAVTVANTGGGMLVFLESDRPGKELAGFADVTDWGVIRDALQHRGLGVGATTNLPVFEAEELPK